jgi:hypothetical protein
MFVCVYESVLKRVFHLTIFYLLNSTRSGEMKFNILPSSVEAIQSSMKDFHLSIQT